MSQSKYDSTISLDHEEVIPALAPASVGDSSCSSDASQTSSLNSSLCHDDAALPTVIQAPRLSKVRFGNVSFRSFPVILGDHPECLGPPLSFDWDFVRENTYDLEQYEAQRSPRKHDEELVLDWFLRKRMLRCYAGVTEDEITKVTNECAKIRKQREQTRKSATLKSSMRYALARVTGGMLGEKPLKHKDRGVHAKRMEKSWHRPANAAAASRQEIRI